MFSIYREIDVKWMITKAQQNCMIDETANKQEKNSGNNQHTNESTIQHFEILPVNPVESMNSKK